MSKYQELFCTKLVEHMALGHSFFSFGAIVDVRREALLNWEAKYPEFKSAHQIGIEYSLLFWEKQMANAASGRERANASLIIFKLRNSFKELYADTKDINISGQIQLVSIDTGINRPPEIVEGEVSKKLIDEL